MKGVISIGDVVKHRLEELELEAAVPLKLSPGAMAVALTPELLCDLYVGAGCSSLHVELLTGQSEAVIRHRMKDGGVPVRRRPRSSPVLLRIRAALRQSWLDGVARRYEQCRSTAQIAAEYGCSQETARRWLIEAGSTLPPRGRWDRRARAHNRDVVAGAEARSRLKRSTDGRARGAPRMSSPSGD